MNNRLLAAGAALLALGLVAVGALFYTTSQTLTETENTLANARTTGTSILVTVAWQGTSTQAQAVALASTATSGYEAQVGTYEAVQAAAATSQAQAQATQTLQALNLKESITDNRNLAASATQNHHQLVAEAATQQGEAEAVQTALAGTATTSFEEQNEAFDIAQVQAAGTQTAAAITATAGYEAQAATQAALTNDLQDSQAAGAALAATATTSFGVQAQEIDRLNADLNTLGTAVAVAKDDTAAMAGELANVSAELEDSEAAATAQAARLEDAEEETDDLQATITAQDRALEGAQAQIATLEANVTVAETDDTSSSTANFALGTPPTKLNNYDGTWEEVLAELESVGLIPADGELLFSNASSLLAGEGGWFDDFGYLRNPHTNVVMSAYITPDFVNTYQRSQEYENCSLSVRIQTGTDQTNWRTYTTVYLDNEGDVYTVDRYGAGQDDYSIVISSEGGFIRTNETYHLLVLVIDDQLIAYVDGRLMLDRVVVEPREGDFLAASSLGVSRASTCAFEDVWTYRLD